MNQFRLISDDLLVDESLLFTGNGYLGVRGNFEEGYPENFSTIRGTYLNGFYDTVDIEYGESAYGFPETAQKLVNVFDAQTIWLEVDGDRFSLFEGQLLGFHRELVLDQGYAVRSVEWASPKGHHFKLSIQRMTSFERPELMLIHYDISSMNYTGSIRILSALDGDVRNYADPKDPRVASGHTKLLIIKEFEIQDGIAQITGRTRRSGLELAATFGHDIPMQYQRGESSIVGEALLPISEGATASFTKYVIYTDSARHQTIKDTGMQLLRDAMDSETKFWFESQEAYLNQFWRTCKVEILGEDGVQEAINYSIYQLLASAGRDRNSNISAKGLSGEGYEGHYFWDTEIYMIPFFTLTNPEIARSLLRFRHQTLPGAKDEARNLGHKKGAKIPWRTISGSECSAYFPAGSAQYHINADVAFSNIQYYLYTSDLTYLCEYGFEILYETARLWLDTGHYDSQGRFVIDGVTGPDEYTAIVNNNYYTNAMAQYHLKWTVKLSDVLQERCQERWQDLVQALAITLDELEQMSLAARDMYLPYSEELGIHLQDDSFLSKKEWDFENTPKEMYPLVLHYHPLHIYRHKVLKQADTVLAHFLLDPEQEDVIRRSYHYYERLNTHDSSLSPCIHSMMASRINDPEKAYHYLMKTLRLDLDNLHSNTKDGLHIANAGGAYMSIVYGFGGLRIKEDGLHLKPTKPHHWSRMAFRLLYRGALVIVTLTDTIQIETDRPIDLWIDQRSYHIEQSLEVAYYGKH